MLLSTWPVFPLTSTFGCFQISYRQHLYCQLSSLDKFVCYRDIFVHFGYCSAGGRGIVFYVVACFVISLICFICFIVCFLFMYVCVVVSLCVVFRGCCFVDCCVVVL